MIDHKFIFLAWDEDVALDVS